MIVPNHDIENGQQLADAGNGDVFERFAENGKRTETYDDAGNMITGPLGTTPTTKLHFVFDAWNCMVTVKADSSGSPGSTIASYAYDGRNRRITKTIGGHTYHGYYNNNWQYLETRIGSSTSSSGQIVWDLRYIDSPLALLGANPSDNPPRFPN